MESAKRFTENEKFITLGSLERFKDKFKTYVDAADKVTADKVTALETTIGDDASGLIQKVNLIQGELDGLSGGAGSITTQITNALAGLDVTDTAVDGQYVSSVSEVDGKISVTRKDLPTYEAVGAADAALTAAKAYTDELANGTVAQHTATLAELTGDGDNSVNSKVAAAIAGVVADAPEAFDTLKEVATWISNNDHASDVATLMTDVENLKKIDHDAYKAAAEAAKNAAIADADAKLTAKANASDVYTKTEVDNKLTAKANASDVYTKTEVEGLFTTNSTADQTYAKQYTDLLFDSFVLATNDEVDALFA